MFDLFIFALYRFALIPLALLILKGLRPFLSEESKLRRMIEERRTPQKYALVARPVWIHAASGEIEYAKPVIRALKSKYPEIPILVTYSSPSAHALMRNIPGIDAFVPIPWDHREHVSRFLDYAQPLAVLFSRTDVWPELAFQLKSRRIPSILFSATLAHNSSRVRGVSRFLNRFALNALDAIFCVNDEDAREFKSLGVKTRVEVLGDSRFDQVFYRLQNPREIKNLHENAAPTLVAGSTWPQDEKVLIAGLSSFIKAGGRIIWAPHEVTDSHLRSLENEFQKNNWTSERYSETQVWSAAISILLVDEVGILPELYTLGDIAFVGGSFRERVHSVMEPLAAGLPVLVGPFHENNREALHFALHTLPEENSLSVVNVVTDAESFSQCLARLSEPNLLRRAHPFIRQEARKQSGVTERIVAEVDWQRDS